MHKKRTDNKAYAQRMSRLRSSTVEPVLGTLINFLNMKRVNTRGIDLANKHVLMASFTYNLKKYLKFIAKKRLSKAMSMTVKAQTALSSCFSLLFRQIRLIFRIFDLMFSGSENSCQKRNPLLERLF
jgi:hypothetical protein